MFVLTNADGVDALTNDADFVVLSLSRREVERGLIGDAADRLMRLSDRGGLVRRFAQRVVLHVDGYDDDPRELVEIPECRNFLGELTEIFPWWLHFAEPRESMPLIIGLLCPNVMVGERDGLQSRSYDSDTLELTIRRLERAAASLHSAHALDPELATRLATALSARFRGPQ